MNIIHITLQLNCFTSNTSVELSAQTKHAIFTAQVLEDDSQDTRICQQLEASVYTAKLIFENYTYEYPKQLTYSSLSNLQIDFPCLEVNNCTIAFDATTVQFQLSFASSNTLIEDSVSNFQIQKYSRLSCIGSYISADSESQSIEIFGEDNGCMVLFDQTKHATITLVAHPDFKLQKTISLSGITSITDLLHNIKFSCSQDYTETIQRTCKRLIKTFVESISSYAELTIDLPGVIPDGNTYGRESAYSIFTEIITISSSFVEQFDCFSSQQVSFFSDVIRLNLPQNESRVYCNQPIFQYIGNFTKTQYIIQVQENVNFLLGQVVTFNFTNIIYDFTQNKPWLSCDQEFSGKQSCIEKIEKIKAMPTCYSFISRTFFNGNEVVKTFQTSSTTRFGRVISANANVSRTQLCFHTTDYFKERTTLQVRVQIVSGVPRYSDIEHDYVLDIWGQIDYPNQEQIYYLFYELNESQSAAYDQLIVSEDVITGVISMYGSQTAITEIQFIDEEKKTNFVLVAVFTAVFICAVWFAITMYYELHPRRGIRK
ncbi:Conserved_hypothetical protein [Hexamita inflata]|uniref:Uncharacterized protein n=1 Tax=Hexamita inflata TaxID=28002 RepID=A0AA86RFM4_9EUKA|nr:Conserved hypothetical protein [Hexamita inflata]